MVTDEMLRPLEGQGEDARALIAGRVGARLLADNIPVAERQAAEALARALSEDAVEQVRRHLSMAVRQAKRLPRDIAMRIAHDVDSVSCPFLKLTDVFSDTEWQQLVLTISRSARIAVAGRETLSEGTALALAELGDTIVAETLVENQFAPMTAPVCTTLVDRFDDAPWVLDKLALREDLLTEIVVKLRDKVSAAARKALLDRYDLADFTEPLAVEADVSVTRELIQQTRDPQLPYLINALLAQNKLTPGLLLVALGDGAILFFELALSAILAQPLQQTRDCVRRGNFESVAELFTRARFPSSLFEDYWKVLQYARRRTPGSRTTH